MSKPISPRSEARLQTMLDYAERLLILLFFIAFAIRVWASLGNSPFNLIALISDGMVVAFILTRRHSQAVTSRAWDWAMAVVGTILPLLLRPGGEALVPTGLSATLMFTGSLSRPV